MTDVVIMEGMGALAVDLAEFSQDSPIVQSLTEGLRAFGSK